MCCTLGCQIKVDLVALETITIHKEVVLANKPHG